LPRTAYARNADAISKVARDAGKAKGPSDVDYRVMVKRPKTMESFVEAGLRVLALSLEMIAQAKSRNEAERQGEDEYARNNPADYLRRFGRVREINANDTNTESGSVRSGKSR
jgi:hypothetical protein